MTILRVWPKATSRLLQCKGWHRYLIRLIPAITQNKAPDKEHDILLGVVLRLGLLRKVDDPANLDFEGAFGKQPDFQIRSRPSSTPGTSLGQWVLLVRRSRIYASHHFQEYVLLKLN